MLTRKDIKEFKESVRRDNDAIIKVGSGETVTVRVPTHEEGRLIFWEFATDYYDIGFGLYFEWTISPSNNVTVHVSDSSEDEEGEEGKCQNGNFSLLKKRILTLIYFKNRRWNQKRYRKRRSCSRKQ